ncbi:hypothetical protein ABGB07_07365 [Micromonosporaceae bacterium B7E4]
MDLRDEAREFLASRRARITSEQAGLPSFVRNARLDILAANQLGQALFAPAFDTLGSAGQPCPLLLPRPARRIGSSGQFGLAPRGDRNSNEPKRRGDRRARRALIVARWRQRRCRFDDQRARWHCTVL